MSTFRDRGGADTIDLARTISASSFASRVVSFAGYSPDSDERQPLRGNVFSQIFSNVFGNAR